MMNGALSMSIAKVAVAFVLILVFLPGCEAKRGVPQPKLTELTPDQLDQVAADAATEVMVWGTSSLFQIKAMTRLKKMVEGLAGPDGRVQQRGKAAELGKKVVPTSIGNILIATNSPVFGKMANAVKLILTDGRKKERILALHAQLRQSHGGQIGAGGPAKDPPGFWEGALENEELSAAHDKFLADVEALANSGLAKKAGASAEAYHQAMLRYAVSKPMPQPDAGKIKKGAQAAGARR